MLEQVDFEFSASSLKCCNVARVPQLGIALDPIVLAG
jgi:hypothetical protein